MLSGVNEGQTTVSVSATYNGVTKEATCEEDGTIVYTVQLPDGSTVEVTVSVPATGHNHGDDGICDDCGDDLNPDDPEDPSEEPSEDAAEATKPGNNGSTDTSDSALMGMWMGLMVMALSGMAVLFTARKKWMNI